jgi:hypothetical protein
LHKLFRINSKISQSKQTLSFHKLVKLVFEKTTYGDIIFIGKNLGINIKACIR